MCLDNMSNRYTNTASCVDKLYREYLKHPKLIVAVDFDSTVYDYEQTGDTYEDTWAVLKRCQDLGFYLVCYTCSAPERYGFIYDYFYTHGITIHGINCNVLPPPANWGPDAKIYYNIFLEDKSGLGQTLEILETLLTKIENR